MAIKLGAVPQQSLVLTMPELNEYTAVILGIVEGVTEFLPISSTGHLILTASVLGLHDEKTKTFEIFIQAGAILAVVVLYWRRFTGFLDFSEGRRFEPGSFRGASGILKLGVCCTPIFLAGALFGSTVKAHFFLPSVVASALITGGVAMLFFENRKTETRTHVLDNVSVAQCLAIGIVQVLALWPGFSRSASTIIGGIMVGLDRKAAAELSFLVAVPVLCAAVVLDLSQSMSVLGYEDIAPFAIGFVVSFITALIAIKGFMYVLGKFSLKPFAIYRIALGLLVLTVWERFLVG